MSSSECESETCDCGEPLDTGALRAGVSLCKECFTTCETWPAPPDAEEECR